MTICYTYKTDQKIIYLTDNKSNKLLVFRSDFMTYSRGAPRDYWTLFPIKGCPVDFKTSGLADQHSRGQPFQFSVGHSENLT